jgi:hypothetical protein
MFALPFHTVSVGLLAAGLLGYADFWQWYVGYFALFASWILLGSWAKRPNGIVPDSSPLFLTEDELRLVKRHAIYFSSPISALHFAAVISVMQLCAIAGAALLLFRSQWIAAAILALVYPAGGSLTALVNPGRLLRYHQARGPLRPEGQALLDVIESIERKHASALEARSEQDKRN